MKVFAVRLFCSFIVILLSLVALPSFAQDSGADQKTVEATDEQARLNDRGVRALGEGDYVKAISLLEEALYLGELNITYLNLGRAYQQAGRCKKARKALQQVSKAPAVEKPPPGFIESKAEEYLREVEQACDSGEKQAGEEATEPEDEEPEVAEDDTEEATAQEEKAEMDEETVEPPPEPEPAGSNAAGLVVTGGGAALMLGAAGMHFFWAEPTRQEVADGVGPGDTVTDVSQEEYFAARDKANAIDTAALATGITGAAVTGLGLYLWLGKSGTERSTSLQLTPSPDGVRASWTLRF